MLLLGMKVQRNQGNAFSSRKGSHVVAVNVFAKRPITRERPHSLQEKGQWHLLSSITCQGMSKECYFSYSITKQLYELASIISSVIRKHPS